MITIELYERLAIVKYVMAEKTAFDASKFEQKRDEIFEMEKKAEWKVAKNFQHSAAYRKGDNKSVFKVSRGTRWHPVSYRLHYN